MSTGFYGVPCNLSKSSRITITEFHEFRERRPMCKAGSHIGSWSKRFYEAAWLVSGYRINDGAINNRRWFKVSKIRSQVHSLETVRAMRMGVLPKENIL